ncbi:ABC transporter substrate-binding protein [Herbiconiux moechotypicola]|uniref:ABC transporter substrate-binding protein n=1 Tax=Herbiconiux moechotypicola TaxID=637393 RepID=A0ABN3DT24_9MICO|nr:ABC transporter substrate-binding protein [Herbiconiux moechotypicola]MCS5730600.1 ABC transporter substrate-binding protein [Herbiconiux moechotypicola]
MSSTAPKPRRAALAVASFAAVAIALTACSSGAGASDPSATPTAGGVLQVDLSAAPNCLDPAVALSQNERAIVRASVDSLLDMDKDGTLVPWLAESWEVNDDATQVVFHLRDGVTFSDGTPLTAEAVKTTFDYIKQQLGSKSSRGNGYLSTYTGTTVVDDLTAQVDFSAPAVQFIAGAATTTLGIISPESATKTPEERCTGDWVGTGPFTLDSYTQGQGATSTARSDYDWSSELAAHTGAPYIEGIEYQVVDTSNARDGALQAGQTDVALDVASQDVPQLEAANVQILVGTLPGMPSSLIVNTTKPGLDDPAVREAMLKGFDREGDVKAVLGEYFTPATSALTSTFPAYKDETELLGYDLDAAEALLDDAGWVPGADGIREKDGVKLEFSVNYSTAFGAYYTSMLQLFQQHMGDLGIGITLNDLRRPTSSPPPPTSRTTSTPPRSPTPTPTSCAAPWPTSCSPTPSCSPRPASPSCSPARRATPRPRRATRPTPSCRMRSWATRSSCPTGRAARSPVCVRA